MSRKLTSGVVLLCFYFSSISMGLATQTMDVAPIIVQPYELEEANQQVMMQDRQNRDEEFAIQQLIAENDKLIQEELSRHQDEDLSQVDQTILGYQKALFTRDQARIMANSAGAPSHYGELVSLTEAADAMTSGQNVMARKGDVLVEKYQILVELRNEMAALNQELANQQAYMAQKDTLLGQYKQMIQQQQYRIKVLVDRLGAMDQKITQFDAVIAQKDQQIAQLKNELIATQQEAAAKYAQLQSQIEALKQKLSQQDTDLKTRDQSINWLNQVLAAAKEKANFYKLTSERDAVTMQQVQGQVDSLKDDLARHFREYEQFETDILSLKDEVAQLGRQLSQKQAQVVLLKSELEQKIVQENDQARVRRYLEAQLADKEGQITQLKADIQSILQQQADLKDRVTLAKELIAAQQQQADLLQQKDKLRVQQGVLVDQETRGFEDMIQGLMVKDQLRAQDLQNRMEELKDALEQREDQVASLTTQLEEKIAQEKDEAVLEYQVQDLKSQLQDKEDQIASLQQEVQQGMAAQAQVGTLKAQLSDARSNAMTLKAELDVKLSQFNQMTLMISDYQKKLEAKDEDYNQELQQVLVLKNTQAQSRLQIADLSARFQEQEASVVKIKQQMYELQQTDAAKDRDAQAQALSFSVRQNMMATKLNDYKQQASDLQNEVDLLKEELNNKITQLDQMNGLAADRTRRQAQIADLTRQLQDQEAALIRIKQHMYALQQEGVARDRDARQQIADLQGQVDLLKGELNSKITQLDQMNGLASDRTRRQAEIADLSKQLQDQEAEALKIRQQMYGLEEANSAKDQLAQAKDMDFAMRQKAMDAQITAEQKRIEQLQADNAQQTQQEADLRQQLSQARQQLSNAPSGDEIEFLKSGLKDATVQLDQKNGVIAQLKTSADQEDLRFKQQAQDLAQLKAQLAQADQQLSSMAGSSDAVDFLRAQLKEATWQLKQKDVEIFRLKSLADQGDIKFKEEARDIEHLTAQLAQARQQASLSTNAQINALKAQLRDAALQLTRKDALLARTKANADTYNKQYQDELQEIARLKAQLAQSSQQDALKAQLSQKDALLARTKANADAYNKQYQDELQEVARLRTELAQARAQLNGLPSGNDIASLKKQLEQTSLQLKDKDEKLFQVSANAEEYNREYKKQFRQFQSLRAQLDNAYDEIKDKDEDLRYKDMAIIRLKEQLTAARKGLPLVNSDGQVQALNAQLKDDEARIQTLQGELTQASNAPVPVEPAAVQPQTDQLKQALAKIDQQDAVINQLNAELEARTGNNDVRSLQTKLSIANLRIRNMEAHIRQLEDMAKGDRLQEKLKQALDEIDEQGRVINLLVDKLQRAGESVDLSKYFVKPPYS